MPRNNIRTQGTISSYFANTTPPRTGKRAASPIDLTVEDDESQSMPKKSRLTGPMPSPSESSLSNPVADNWRYSPGQEKSKQQLSKPRSKYEKERHEAFKRKLLQDNSFMMKRVHKEPKADEGELDSDSGSASDSLEKLNETFSHQPKGKKPIARNSASKTRMGMVGKTIEAGPSGQSYTPLEKQIIRLKKENAETVLMVEVGYKYRFFGEDAKVAAKELGMVAFMDRNFLVASIPVHRRDIHLKKLLSSGYRVGIVNQIETAALKKVGDNRNAPFERKLTNLYTQATYIDGLNSVDDLEEHTASTFICLVEEQASKGTSDVSIGMVTICPSTGDVVYDDFDDTIMRLELETRLVHTQPAEVLICEDNLSPATRKMVLHLAGISSSRCHMRIEKLSKDMAYPDASAKVTKFYTDKRRLGIASENFKSGKLMAAAIELPKRVVIALAQAINHLSSFGIADAFLESQFFTKFTTRAHMLLAANTLINLQIYRNEDDHTERGSLIWALDRTKTKFGSRLLRNWVARPLVDKRLLQERVDAIQEILESSSEKLLTLRGLLRGLPDLAKGLCRIQYGQCTLKELSILLPAFNKVARAFDPSENECDQLKSDILNNIINSLPRLMEPMKEILKAVDLKKVAEGDKTSIWNDWDRHPEIEDAQMSLQAIEIELNDELAAARKVLRMPSLQWTTVAIDDHLIEVRKSENRPIPDNWILHSRTKFYARYRPPSVQAKLDERAQRRETLEHEANRAYRSFLTEISEKYYGVLRDGVTKLATADCLLSLAQVALQKDYTKPDFTDNDVLEIVDGRHPIIEAYSNDPYISNSVKMGGGEACSKIITGPNMGGKSSCVRMIALLALMAQIGSYVPAASLRMGLLDSILTRMGASDDLARGRSTFMVEMSETSEILRTATNRSLVILDELGRGTSTFDGMAIADATLQYLVEKTKSKTLFITHYPLLAKKLQSRFPKDIQNLHMGYEAESRVDGSRSITFLYRLIPGLATESFGIECARMAKVPEKVVSRAAERATHMQEEVQQRTRRNQLLKVPYLIQKSLSSTGIAAEAALEDLRTTMELLRVPT
ncbi:hypothetical protein BDN70DRAFT_881277 [Pholiota conissans]|uniref:DNA mismatch repair protein MSH3 n=1 Tax=Pholiota conissans TaxID=109636 RepID=A0A9P5YZH9_9AGAR|nr:hypothetical protein BDN70DRAFT_881277 [Pholiota conissans]